MIRNKKEAKILKWLEELKQINEPIKLYKHGYIVDTQRFSETYQARIRGTKSQFIYNVTIDKVAQIKKIMDEKNI